MRQAPHAFTIGQPNQVASRQSNSYTLQVATLLFPETTFHATLLPHFFPHAHTDPEGLQGWHPDDFQRPRPGGPGRGGPDVHPDVAQPGPGGNTDWDNMYG